MKRSKKMTKMNITPTRWLKGSRRIVTCLLLGWLGIFLFMGNQLAYGQSPTQLSEWIELALATNPDYLMELKDYHLALKGTQAMEEDGIERVYFSMNPLTITNDGFGQYPEMSIQFSGNLPYEIHLSGSQTIQRNPNTGLDFNGGVQLSWNWREFLAQQEQEDLGWLQQEKKLYQAQMGLVDQVMQSYYRLLTNQLQLERASTEIRLRRVQWEQGQSKYQAGLISEYDLMQLKIALAEAQTGHADLQWERKRQLQEFAWLFGDQADLLKEHQQLGLFFAQDLQMQAVVDWFTKDRLFLKDVDDFLADWNPAEVESYLDRNYDYQLALDNLREQEEALAEVRQAQQWQINVGTNISYDAGRDEPFSFMGTVGVTKELYQRQQSLKVEQGELALEREKLAIARLQTQLAYQLKSQVSEIQLLEDQWADLTKKLLDLEISLARTQEQYQAGYLSKIEVLQGEMMLDEQLQGYLQLHTQLVSAKVGLGKLLYLAELWK